MKNSEKYYSNIDCKYFPCHKGLTDFNCMFCFCPLYQKGNCPGNPSYFEKNGSKIKDCTECTFPHNPDNYDTIMSILKNQ